MLCRYKSHAFPLLYILNAPRWYLQYTPWLDTLLLSRFVFHNAVARILTVIISTKNSTIFRSSIDRKSAIWTLPTRSSGKFKYSNFSVIRTLSSFTRSCPHRPTSSWSLSTFLAASSLIIFSTMANYLKKKPSVFSSRSSRGSTTVIATWLVLCNSPDTYSDPLC